VVVVVDRGLEGVVASYVAGRGEENLRGDGVEGGDDGLLEELVPGGACYGGGEGSLGASGFCSVDSGGWGGEDWVVQVVIGSLLWWWFGVVRGGRGKVMLVNDKISTRQQKVAKFQRHTNQSHLSDRMRHDWD